MLSNITIVVGANSNLRFKFKNLINPTKMKNIYKHALFQRGNALVSQK